MYQVDLNSDLGESFGRYTIGMDEKIIPLISSANIACGYHASDPVVMLESIARTKEAGIKIGAHPGLPDLMGFGRRNMAISPEEAKAYTLYQISALGGMCQANGMRLQHVKPHGALYNMAAKDYALSLAICEAIRDYDPEIIVMGLSGSEMIRAARELSVSSPFRSLIPTRITRSTGCSFSYTIPTYCPFPSVVVSAAVSSACCVLSVPVFSSPVSTLVCRNSYSFCIVSSSG